MTVSNTNLRGDYIENGVTTQFPIPFYFLDQSHVLVVGTPSGGTPAPLVLGSDYTVAGAGVAGGGTLTILTPTNGRQLAILRDVPYTQLTHYVENDPFPAASHEAALDLLTMQNQQQQEELDRALKLPLGMAGVPMPPPVEGSVVGWVSGAWAWLSQASVSLAANLLTATRGYGADLVRYLAPLTGAIGRLLYLKLSEHVSPEDFGAIGDGVADDYPAIVAAMAASLHVEFGDKTYLISSPLPVRTGQTLIFRGTTIKTKFRNQNGIYCNGINDFSLVGALNLIGTITVSPAYASDGGSGVVVKDCYNWRMTGVDVSWFNGNGLVVTNSSMSLQVGPGMSAGLIYGCSFNQNGYGVVNTAGFMSEFCTFSDCNAIGNALAGYSGYAGNTNWTGGTIANNGQIGVDIQDTYQGNSNHGTFNGVIIVHNGLWQVACTYVEFGMTFSGCTIAGGSWPGDWVTGHAYSVSDLVTINGLGYTCLVAHTSGTFATDLGSGKWAAWTPGTGGIKLYESTGVTFSACLLGVDIYTTNSLVNSVNLFIGCAYYPGGGTWGRLYKVYPSDSSLTTVVLRDCYQMGILGYGSPNSGLSTSDCQCTAGSDQAIANASPTKIAWNDVENQHGRNIYSSTNKNFVVVEPGVYRINVYMQLASSGSMPSSGLVGEIYVNGSVKRFKNFTGYNATDAFQDMTATLTLNQGDVVDFYILSPSGSCTLKSASSISISKG